MFKLLLCWRYLRTRWIAIASIVSVMLGVATMIVVNSVMSGFSNEMQNRLHSILSDVVIESHSLTGFPDPHWYMEQIRSTCGEDIAGMTPIVAVPAMLSFQYGGSWITQPVQLVGIDEKTQQDAGDFGQFLQHPANREALSFALRPSGYDAQDIPDQAPGQSRPALTNAGWAHRRRVAAHKAWEEEQMRKQQALQAPPAAPPADTANNNPVAKNDATAEG